MVKFCGDNFDQSVLFRVSQLLSWPCVWWQHSYVDIASVMHSALPESDLIASDVTAGLILLRHFQRLRQKLLVSQVFNCSVAYTVIKVPVSVY